MTNTLTPRPTGRKAVQLAVALTTGLGLAAPLPALAEPTAPSGKVRPLVKRNHYGRADVTIIIIDDERRSRSTAPKPRPGRETASAPSGRVDRDDDNTRIIIRKNRKTAGGGTTPDKSGPRVIIVDRNRDTDCDGVCIIRP